MSAAYLKADRPSGFVAAPVQVHCTGKCAYPNQETALRVLDSMRIKKARPNPLTPYRCVVCHKWHVGTLSGRRTLTHRLRAPGE